MIASVLMGLWLIPLPPLLEAQTIQTWRYRTHATDCTALTDGKVTDLCFEVDSDRLFKCVPSAGDCSGAEWQEVKFLIVDADVPATISRDSELATHEADTSVHGVADTTALITGSSPTITTPNITLENGAGAAPTTDGRLKYDRTAERLQVGDGAATQEFVPVGTLTDTKFCTYDAAGAEIDCTSEGGVGSGTDENAIHDNVGGEIAAIADKATPVGADHLLIEDSAASDAKKDITISSLTSVFATDTELSTHDTDTTDVHGITNTAVLLAGGSLTDEKFCTWDNVNSVIVCDTDAPGGGSNVISGDDGILYFDPATASESDWWVGPNHDAAGDDDDCLEMRQSATPGTNVRLSVCPDGTISTPASAASNAELELFESTANGTGSVLMGINGNIANSQKDCRFDLNGELPDGCIEGVTELITLSGVAEDAVNLGTFTGVTISDSDTIKGALQDLETALELVGGGTTPVFDVTDPGATNIFLKWDDTENEVDFESAATHRTSLSVAVFDSVDPGAANIFTKWDDVENEIDWESAATHRASLSVAVFDSVDPGATNIFPKWDDTDNEIDWESAATHLTSLGAAASATTLTVAGTSNEITSSAGAQDLTANRTWTLSLPATIDLGAKTSLEIPNGTDPNTSAAGQLHQDNDGANVTNDVTLRGYDGTNQFAFARKLHCIHATVVAPNDLADATRDAFLMWSNETGMTFTIISWAGYAGTDNTTLDIEETTGTGASNSTVDAVEIATDGTAMFTASDTTITAGVIETGNLLWLDFDDTDAPAWVKMSICGWFNSDVD